MADDAGGDETSLEFTPTWVVALVCFCIVFISIAVHRFSRRAGKVLRDHETWPLILASRKIKDELMLLGFISLLLAVFQSRIGKICVSEQLANVWLPCKKHDSSSTVANLVTSSFTSTGTRGRRLLAMASDTSDYCSQKGKVPLFSGEAVHHLHIFIFVLASFHVVLCLLKVLSMIIQWRCLKIYDELLRGSPHLQNLVAPTVNGRIENRPGCFLSVMFGILQWITSMSLFEYCALRGKFLEVYVDIDTDFQKYIIWTLQKEFEKMIGIRWYLWLFAVIYLLVNVAGWHAYFWISFIPLILWLVVHFKLESTIRRLLKPLAVNLTRNEKEPSKDAAEDSAFQFSGFWFGRRNLVGNVIHFVLFENSLQLAFFFFILFQYGFRSCIMGKVGFVVPRIVIGMLLQLLCTCRTLPLLAIIKSQMTLKAEQPDIQHKIYKIKKHLKEYLSDKHIEKRLHDLDEIKIPLKDIMDKEKEMPILNWISELIDERKNRRKEPSSPEAATDIERTQTGSREGSIGHEITEDADANPIADIEAQKSPTDPNK